MASIKRLLLLSLCCACAYAQYEDERPARYIASESKPTSTPVPILKQINRHNEDGSYTYGYEAADGSFKIETKTQNGEVKGKYGYKDDTGKLRVVEYGANKYGFQPAGEGITVAPPTLVDESTREEELRPSKSQGGRSQYRAPVQAQAVDYDYEEPAPRPAPAPRPRPQQQQQQQYRPQQFSAPQPKQGPAPPKPAFFAGAAPAPAPLGGNLFSPAPLRPKPRQQEYRPAPAQQYQSHSPRPQIEYTQEYNPEPEQRFSPQSYQQPSQNFQQSSQNFQQSFPQQRSQQAPFSMLDQLLKEYSLPQNGAAPTHDITFGTY